MTTFLITILILSLVANVVLGALLKESLNSAKDTKAELVEWLSLYGEIASSYREAKAKVEDIQEWENFTKAVAEISRQRNEIRNLESQLQHARSKPNNLRRALLHQSANLARVVEAVSVAIAPHAGKDEETLAEEAEMWEPRAQNVSPVDVIEPFKENA